MNSLTLLDPDFDSLNIADSQTGHPARKPTPHCDCYEANVAFFGPIQKAADNDEDATYQMVPVKAEANGSCPHCGYLTCLLPEQEHARQLDNRKLFASRAKAVEAGKYKVVGKHIESGEVVEFPSAKHAYLAGFGSVQWALKHNRPLKGYEWKRV